MSLCDRIRAVAPHCSTFSYRPNYFRFKNYEFDSYASVIDFVLERFARRFGPIRCDEAEKMQAVLADRYCERPEVTLRYVRGRNKSGITYPQSLIGKRLLAVLEGEEIVKGIAKSYEQPDGDYCLICSSQYSCDCCGAPTMYKVFGPHGKSYTQRWVFLNGWYVCRDKRCRAVAVHYKGVKRGKTERMANVILEAIKKDGENEFRRKIEKHFVRRA